MADSFKFTLDTSEITHKLEALTTHIQDKVARAGAQAMAQVVYEAAKANAPVSTKAHIFTSKKAGQKYLFYPGDLRAAIYQVHSKDRSVLGKQVYHVSWNRKKAPYGQWVEFGSRREAARPFLYPAFNDNRGQLFPAAVAVMRQVLGEMP